MTDTLDTDEPHWPYGEPWPDARSVPANHLWLLVAAEEGRLRYDTDRYRVHGLPNNAMDLLDGGLLCDGQDGPVLTNAGRRRLDMERPRLAWWDLDDDEDADPVPPTVVPDITPPAPQPCGQQLDLFAVEREAKHHR